jgi:hypothetical protein
VSRRTFETLGLILGLLFTNAVTWWVTASHFEVLALKHGAAYRIRFADGGSELRWRDVETKGVWK